jgi:hypothetical protein
MRTLRTFRPAVLDSLEDRLVLNGPGTGLGNLLAPPVQVQDAFKVHQAFETFEHSYFNDVRTILFKAGSDGTVSPSTNRDAFNTQVATDLTTLNTSIDKIIANLSSASTLGQTIQGELLGSDPNSLQSRLAALATPGGTNTLTARQFLAGSDSAIHLSEGQVDPQVLHATNTSPTGGVSRATLLKDVGQVQVAFGKFSRSYVNAFQTVLLARGSDGKINPTANRAAFDAKVGDALTTLNSDIDSALANLPDGTASSSTSTTPQTKAALLSAIQDALLGSASTSLKSRLAAIPTPSAVNFLSIARFGFASVQAIGGADQNVVSLVTSFAKNVNTGTGTTGAGQA